MGWQAVVGVIGGTVEVVTVTGGPVEVMVVNPTVEFSLYDGVDPNGFVESGEETVVMLVLGEVPGFEVSDTVVEGQTHSEGVTDVVVEFTVVGVV